MDSQIPNDQAIEHFNKTEKVAGSLMGIARNDTARDTWCITFNERAELARDTRTMLNLTAGNEEEEHQSSHKDFGIPSLAQCKNSQH